MLLPLSYSYYTPYFSNILIHVSICKGVLFYYVKFIRTSYK